MWQNPRPRGGGAHTPHRNPHDVVFALFVISRRRSRALSRRVSASALSRSSHDHATCKNTNPHSTASCGSHSQSRVDSAVSEIASPSRVRRESGRQGGQGSGSGQCFTFTGRRVFQESNWEPGLIKTGRYTTLTDRSNIVYTPGRPGRRQAPPGAAPAAERDRHREVRPRVCWRCTSRTVRTGVATLLLRGS